MTTYREPEITDADLRIDTGVREGSEISVYYDPMISKVIAHGPNREAACTRLKDALDSFVVRGVNHNVNFLRSLLSHPRFMKGDLTTKFIPEEYPEGFKGHPLNTRQMKQLISTAALMHLMRVQRDNDVTERLPHAVVPDRMDLVVEVAGHRYHVFVANDHDSFGYAVGFATEVKPMPGAFGALLIL